MRFLTRPLLTLVFLLVCGTAVYAGRHDTDPGVIIGDESTQLPEDSGAWYLTVFTSASPSAEEQRFLGWFEIGRASCRERV